MKFIFFGWQSIVNINKRAAKRHTRYTTTRFHTCECAVARLHNIYLTQSMTGTMYRFLPFSPETKLKSST